MATPTSLLRTGFALCASVALVLAGPVQAGALRILPVRVEVAPGKQFCALSLANDAPVPVTVQVRGYGWSKDADNADLLDPANGPLVNPAIVTIAAGESQLIRCSLPGTSGGREETYRLIVDERPTMAAPPGTIRALLRLSIPVFRAPAAAQPVLGWEVLKAPDGSRELVLTNSGGRHAQITAVTLRSRGGQTESVALASGFYLLAGGRVALPLAALPSGGIGAVEVETAAGHLAAAPAKTDPAPGA